MQDGAPGVPERISGQLDGSWANMDGRGAVTGRDVFPPLEIPKGATRKAHLARPGDRLRQIIIDIPQEEWSGNERHASVHSLRKHLERGGPISFLVWYGPGWALLGPPRLALFLPDAVGLPALSDERRRDSGLRLRAVVFGSRHDPSSSLMTPNQDCDCASAVTGTAPGHRHGTWAWNQQTNLTHATAWDSRLLECRPLRCPAISVAACARPQPTRRSARPPNGSHCEAVQHRQQTMGGR
jgi:hypothetical protein